MVAHDWGGAVAWNFAAAHPQYLSHLVIVNAPHPVTFARELQHSAAQQRASAYMNFLIRPDAEALLAEDDYRRLWDFFLNMGAGKRADGSDHGWLTEDVKAQYRAIWDRGLTGSLNYYRASPLRPPSADDPAATAIDLPQEMLTIDVPTLVVWGLSDTALPPELIDGLDAYIPRLTLQRVPDATHWIVHEQPALVTDALQRFLLSIT